MRLTNFALILFCYCFLSNQSLAATCLIHEPFCYAHCCPYMVGENNDIVNNDIYVLSSNRTTKFADWVAYIIEAKNINNEIIDDSEKRDWKIDPSLCERYTLNPDDYINAKSLNYDRGHQAPLGTFVKSAMSEKTNYLSNITPQKSNLNQGAWNNLENAERKLIKEHGYKYVYVVTGPYYDKNELMPKLPNSHLEHLVPNGYWKAILVENNEKKIGVVTFKLWQYENKQEPYCNHITDLASIKAITNIEVFPNLNKENISLDATKQLIIDLGC